MAHGATFSRTLLGTIIFLTPWGGYAIVTLRDSVSRKLQNLSSNILSRFENNEFDYEYWYEATRKNKKRNEEIIAFIQNSKDINRRLLLSVWKNLVKLFS